MSKTSGDLDQKLGRTSLRLLAALIGLVLSASVVADSAGASQRQIDEIIVYDHGRSGLHLQENTAVGGRLGLAVFDLPGSVDVIDHETMTLRGDYDASQGWCWPGVAPSSGNDATLPDAKRWLLNNVNGGSEIAGAQGPGFALSYG